MPTTTKGEALLSRITLLTLAGSTPNFFEAEIQVYVHKVVVRGPQSQ